MVLVGIPLFAFTFCGLGYLIPGTFGGVQWLAAAAGGIIAWKVGVLVAERLAYTFMPVGRRDA